MGFIAPVPVHAIVPRSAWSLRIRTKQLMYLIVNWKNCIWGTEEIIIWWSAYSPRISHWDWWVARRKRSWAWLYRQQLISVCTLLHVHTHEQAHTMWVETQLYTLVFYYYLFIHNWIYKLILTSTINNFLSRLWHTHVLVSKSFHLLETHKHIKHLCDAL